MIHDPKQAVILCGGLGIRLRPITDNVPKPMVKVNDKPFLFYLMQQLSDQGIKNFVVLTGYLKEQISDYFQDGKDFNWKIQYSKGPVEWDTGKRLWEARNIIDNRFLLLYSDNFASFSLSKLVKHHNQLGLPLTLTLSKKQPGNISIDKEGIIKNYDNKRTEPDLKYVEIGYMLVERDEIFDFYRNSDINLSSIISDMIKKKKVSGFIQGDPYHSISDHKRLEITKSYLSNKKILLIDRDGTINTKLPRGEYVSKWTDFQWLPKVKCALKTLAAEGFKFIVISNQAGVARGMINDNELDIITKKMEQKLAESSIEILQTYICPHHWDANCSCRKPNPGLFFQASRDWLFRLDRTFFIGDDPRDCQAAYNAGCGSIFLGHKDELAHLDQEELPISIHQDFLDATPTIIKRFNQEVDS